MSFEGYVQAICANGHLFTYDVYDKTSCYECGAKAVRENLVDTTNGADEGYIDEDLMSAFLITSATYIIPSDAAWERIKAQARGSAPALVESALPDEDID